MIQSSSVRAFRHRRVFSRRSAVAKRSGISNTREYDATFAHDLNFAFNLLLVSICHKCFLVDSMDDSLHIHRRGAGSSNSPSLPLSLLSLFSFRYLFTKETFSRPLHQQALELETLIVSGKISIESQTIL